MIVKGVDDATYDAASKRIYAAGDGAVTVIAQTPTFYIALYEQDVFGPDSVGQVRLCLTYGGQIPPAVIEAWAAAAPDVLWATYWGQSELSQLGTVGFFRTAEQFANLLGFAQLAIGSVLTPRLSRAFASGRHGEAQSLSVWSARIMFATCAAR